MMIMLDGRITLNREPLFILKTLQDAGYDGYIVGGAVRDLLMQLQDRSNGQAIEPPHDYDFTTNASPEEILSLFPDAFYENEFGTVMITPEDLRRQFDLPEPTVKEIKTESNRLIDLAKATKIHESLEIPEAVAFKHDAVVERNFEITTYRSEGAYSDRRRPDSVEWGQTIEEDLERRDFTINALAINISEPILDRHAAAAITHEEIELGRDEYQVIDYHGGIRDLEEGIIRTVGSATERFEEDALRMLRAIRLSVQLNMRIEEETFGAIEKLSILVSEISFERISAEFLKMLSSNYPKEAIEILDQVGLLEYILPELLDAKGVEQGGHHTTDVWTHSLDALAACPSPDPVVRLATLLHDIAKPKTYQETDGKITFYNHEIVGSRMSKMIAERLRLSKHNQERVFALVRYHMFYYQPENTDASIRRLMRKIGLENIDDILDLREADRLGSGARKTSWRLEELKSRMIEQLNQPMEIRDLAIDGHVLMSELGLEPGPELGNILSQLFELVLDNPELNNKESLLNEAKKII